MSRITWLGLVPVLAPLACYSAQYLTVEQAQRVLFPEATSFAKKPLVLTGDQAKKIEKRSDTRVRSQDLTLFEALKGKKRLGWVFIDEVVGKHEFITYAVGINPEGKVGGIEILVYRETYGGEVRQAEWRRQFHGKTSKNPVKLEEDIKNISGATLSSKHLTDGVRRLLATYDEAIRNEKKTSANAKL
ncbi:MAG: FMN-binding protein [Bdellovibrionales bacterium]